MSTQPPSRATGDTVRPPDPARRGESNGCQWPVVTVLGAFAVGAQCSWIAPGSDPGTGRTGRLPLAAHRLDPMSQVIDTAVVPRRVSLFGAVLRRLLVRGVPLGPNGLITVRGRKTGLPRTTAVAIIEVSGRRWVWAPWGEVQWVRNLRAAGRATVVKRGKKEEVSARELNAAERIAFFRDVLAPLARSVRGGMTFFRVADGVDLRKPVEIAEGRRVFELEPLATAGAHGR